MARTIWADFKERLFSQWRDSDNIQGLVKILSDPLQDSNDAMDWILAHFSIDDADGEQLELLGQLIGVRRPRAQEPDIFTMCRKGEVVHPNLGFHDDSRPGGYLTTILGLEDQDDATATMSDADYRVLIRQKAAAYRANVTRELLFEYLIEFEARCKIDDDTDMTVVIEQARYADLDAWSRNYIETKGFKPAGITIRFDENLEHGDSV